MTDFKLNFENQLIYGSWCNNDNFYYKKFNSNSHKCLIFFAGNSLYFPDEEEEFKKKIIQENRYEGENISESSRMKAYFGKIIWVRDIYKSWYVTGINRTYDSVEKVCELLKSLTEGYDVYTVGGSAGGYMATICGIKLHAKAVYNLAGQYNLFLGGNIQRELLHVYKADKNRNRYYDIADLTFGDVPILYFYSGKCAEDIEQAEYVYEKNQKNIFYFCMKEKAHGKAVKGRNLIYILTMDHKKLIPYSKYGKQIGKTMFFMKTAGVLPCIRGVCEEKIVHLKTKLYPLKQRILSK